MYSGTGGAVGTLGTGGDRGYSGNRWGRGYFTNRWGRGYFTTRWGLVGVVFYEQVGAWVLEETKRGSWVLSEQVLNRYM